MGIAGGEVQENGTEIQGDSRMMQGDAIVAAHKHDNEVRELNADNSEIMTNKLLISGKIAGREPSDRDESDELRRNLHRVWELESEEEVRKLTNSYYPPVRSNRQKRAEAMLMDNLERLENGQYQTRLLWHTDRRPHNNYDEAKKAYLNWERRLATDLKLSDAFHVAMAN